MLEPMLEGMLEKLEGTIPGSPLPHYVSNMFLICFYGSFFLDATDFHSRIPYVVVNDQTPGSIIEYYYYLSSFPPSIHPLFLIPLLLLQSRFWRFWFHYPSDDLLSRFHWLVLLPIPQFAIDALNLD